MCVVWGEEDERETERRVKEMDGLGGEEISGVKRGQQMDENEGRRRRERERGSWKFSCLARLRSWPWSVGQLDPEISYQKARVQSGPARYRTYCP